MLLEYNETSIKMLKTYLFFTYYFNCNSVIAVKNFLLIIKYLNRNNYLERKFLIAM